MSVYLMMNKPSGYVCSAASDRHKTVYSLLPEDLQEKVQGAVRGKRLHTVGRLDCDTSGLLLLTDDGQFSHALSFPSKKITKVYEALLKTPVDFENQKLYIEKFSKGLLLPPDKKWGEQKTEPAELSFIKADVCRVKISEGKFHQVKRMFLAVGNEVTGLKRLQIAGLLLDSQLAEGEYRFLTNADFKLLDILE